VLLHLVELLRLDRRQWVFLCVDGVVLQREIDLGERDRRRVGAERLRKREVRGCVRDADLEALHVLGLGHRMRRVRRHLARAVVGQRRDVVAGLHVVTLGELAEDVAVGVLQLVLGVAEDEREVGDRERRVAATGEARAGEDDVDGAERQPLVDVGLLAEARRRKDLDLVAPVGALLDLVAGPHRVLVERLRGLVDVRPLELGLRVRGRQRGERGGGECAGDECLQGGSFGRHAAVSVLAMDIDRRPSTGARKASHGTGRARARTTGQTLKRERRLSPSERRRSGRCHAQPISAGSQVATAGTRKTSASRSTLIARYGTTARKMSSIVTCGGATPFIVISSRPCGGSSSPICMQIRNSTPNQTRSMPSFCTIGMKIGSVIIIMLTWSTKTPRKMSSSIMPTITAHGARPAPVIVCERPFDAPENERICANVVAPTMMKRIMAEIA